MIISDKALMLKYKQVRFNQVRNLDKWLLVFLSGLSVFYVLFVFKGFDIQTGNSLSGHNLFTRTLVFGIGTSLVFYLSEFQISKYLKPDTLLKRVVLFGIEVFLGINITFLLFNYFWNGEEWTISAYTFFLYEYPSILIFPILISWLISKFLNLAENSHSNMLKFSAENGKEFIDISHTEFLYLKSAGNYIEVFYLSQDQLKKELIRNSLKAIEAAFGNHQNIMRCHRSYLVNPIQIKSIIRKKGKAELDLGNAVIPVSEKYESQFMN